MGKSKALKNSQDLCPKAEALMKAAEKKAEQSWIIDPFKSFAQGSEGAKRQEIFIEGHWRHRQLDEPTLWEYGKRAFDIFISESDGNLTEAGFYESFSDFPAQLIELWNRNADFFNPHIESGDVQFSIEGSDEPIAQLDPITIDPNGLWAGLTIEPEIFMLDDLYEQVSLQFAEDEDSEFPYHRELIAAYYTLLHVDTSAACASLNDPDNGDWVTRWFDRLDNYERTKRTIARRQEYLKRQKSQTMNSKRHAKRNEAVQLVTNDWKERKNEFRSAEKAGKYYADWLESKGFEYEPRTVTNWIRKCAKDNDIRLR